MGDRRKHDDSARTLTRAVAASGMMLALAASLLIAAFAYPIRGSVDVDAAASPTRDRTVRPFQPSMHTLLAQIDRRQLIEPAQVQPAVRDTGAAKKLLDQLTLRSIVRLHDEYVAYVGVERRGTQSVRAGDYLLQFVVDRIEPGRVHLSLEGVQVELTH